MELISLLVDFITNMPTILNTWSHDLGFWVYVILFLVIFAETGLVVTPLLPGDSLLFALGALAANPDSFFNIILLFIVLFIAAILGDFVNYHVGSFFGRQMIASTRFRLVKQEHIDKTHAFFVKYGGKTIVIARFLPIVRTYAPFVAGIGSMDKKLFFFYNVIGGFLWVFSFLVAGYFFGNIPAVQTNFHYVIAGIIVVSLLPPIYEFLRARSEKSV